MNIKYLTKVIKGASFEKLKKAINEVHEKANKNKFITFVDMLFCAVKYGAGYNDYVIFEFYNLTSAQRKTYLTRLKNKRMINELNNSEYTYLFNEKNEFDKKFKDFLNREVIDLKEITFDKFQEFVKGKENIFAKPNVGECGEGIEKIHIKDFKNLEELYSYITSPDKNFGIIEEEIIQHEDIAKIYPYSVNCLRVVTLVNEGVAHVLYAVFKTGNNKKFVDNLESGGFACHVDLETGKVTGPGHTSKLVNADYHPLTNIKFEGFQIPYIDEVKELVKKAALVVPEFRYVGWDVCITKNGPAIIEGNDYPAYDFPQLPDSNRPRIGLIPTIESFGIKVRK